MTTNQTPNPNYDATDTVVDITTATLNIARHKMDVEWFDVEVDAEFADCSLAYTEGYKAFAEGPLESPYDAGTEEDGDYYQGYYDAERESKGDSEEESVGDLAEPDEDEEDDDDDDDDEDGQRSPTEPHVGVWFPDMEKWYYQVFIGTTVEDRVAALVVAVEEAVAEWEVSQVDFGEDDSDDLDDDDEEDSLIDDE